MANLTLRNIPEEHYRALKRDAKKHGRSLNAELLAIVADRAEMARRHARAAKAMVHIDLIREEIARQYPDQLDSADLIREDRDSR